MSEHIQAAIVDCEQKIGALTKLVEQLRWFQREFPHSAAAVERARPAGNGALKKTKRNETKRNEQKARQPAARSRPKPAVSENPLRQRLNLVPARDAAIKLALKKGPLLPSALLDAMPRELGQTGDQRADALRNALTRLRLKKEIRQTDDGWTLA